MNAKFELWRNKKKELGLTNKQIAEISNLPLRTVEQVMCGKVKSPRLDTVEAIEKALGISPSRLEWTDEEKALGVTDTVTAKLSTEDWEWLELKSEVIRVQGDDYYKTLKKMIQAVIKN